MQRSRQAERLGFHRTKLRAAVHSGMVRWAKPKSLPDVLDGAVSEAEMARSKAEIAIRHAKAARKAARQAKAAKGAKAAAPAKGMAKAIANNEKEGTSCGSNSDQIDALLLSQLG